MSENLCIVCKVDMGESKAAAPPLLSNYPNPNPNPNRIERDDLLRLKENIEMRKMLTDYEIQLLVDTLNLRLRYQFNHYG
jgi:hypothetical protein